MTIGIYYLYWEQEDAKLYIGYSRNIEKRIKEHIRDMINNTHHSFKVQLMYDRYGTVGRLSGIIEECTATDLNLLEISWVEEFNSYKSGLNCTKGGDGVGAGTEAASSKYSKRVILKAFSLLYKTNLTYKEIADLIGIDTPSTVGHIVHTGTHMWLKESYPEQYSLMINKVRGIGRKAGISKGGFQPLFIYTITSPDGKVYENIKSLKEFACTHPLLKGATENSSRTLLTLVSSGTRKTHKGFTVTRKRISQA